MNKIKAFTLIELLVVVAIIAILSSIVMTNFASSRSRARDAERISDMGQVQLALELYFDRCKSYPSAAGTWLVVPGNNCSAGVNLGSFISVLPVPSMLSTNPYVYSTSGNDYILKATLEKYNDVLADDKRELHDSCTFVLNSSTGS